MTKSTFTKTKAQMKSSSYYTFWGIATVAVVAGQIYVGTGYRSMSKSLDAWFDKTISIMIQKRLMGQPERGGVEFLNRPDERPRGTYEPILPPPRINLDDYNPDDYIIWKTTESNVNVN